MIIFFPMKIKNIDILLLFLFRRIYLGLTHLVGVRELFYALWGIYLSGRAPSKFIFFSYGLGLYYFIYISIASLFAWKYDYTLEQTLESSYFILSFGLIGFFSLSQKISKSGFYNIAACALGYVFLRKIFLGDRSGGEIFGIYGWPNSTWLSASMMSLSISEFLNKQLRTRTVFIFLISAAVLVFDSQRGGFVDLFVAVGLIIVFKKNDAFLRKCITILAVLLISLVMLQIDERSSGDFFMSIIDPENYGDDYSSSLSRLDQIVSGLNAWEESIKTLLLGVGPGAMIINDEWRNVHMGYVSILAKYGLLGAVPFYGFLIMLLVFSLKNIRSNSATIFDIFFICICADALTQTTFDSVPTAAVSIFIIANQFAIRSSRQDLSIADRRSLGVVPDK